MRSRPGLAPILLAATLALCLAGTGAGADPDPAAEAMAAAQELAASVNGMKAAMTARDRIAALTRTIRAFETGLTGVRSALRSVTLREAAMQKALDAKRAQISNLLGAMIALGAAPKPFVLVHPGGALKSVEAAIVMQDVTPQLQAQAAALKAQLDEISRLRASRLAAEKALTQGMNDVREARTALSQAISNRVNLPRRLIDDPAELKRLAASATSLADFAAGLKADPNAAQGFSKQKGRLPMPVLGRIALRPGEANAIGVTRPGITIATAPAALVTAPWPSTVRYVGPLTGYGNVMILDPGDGYLVILAGMAELYVKTGQIVGANAPLGLMGGGNAVAADLRPMQQTGAEAPERLYLELRKGTRPVDPLRWFVANSGAD